MAALCTPQVCWTLTNARLEADAMAIVKCPNRMQKHGEMTCLWKAKEIEVKKRI